MTLFRQFLVQRVDPSLAEPYRGEGEQAAVKRRALLSIYAFYSSLNAKENDVHDRNAHEL